DASVCEYARRHLSSTTSTHHVNRGQNCLTSCRLQLRRNWKPRAHLELMISMAAMVIFWTADLRVTASTREGASSLVVANPGPVALAHSYGWSGRLRD